ncbi:STAS domain-containing protein [Streptomyces sp. NPDC050095]|uniref:STAS domain-containing protein n=1 Tax=unclassified Streptomyces TaxID=2593676 RepID=UPI00342E6E28
MSGADHSPFGFRACTQTRSEGDDVLVVELWGELDILAAEKLRPLVIGRTRGWPGPLLFDLRRVSFMDCSALSLLCLLRRQADPRHGRPTLVTDNPFFVRLLRLAGLLDTFHVIPDMHPSLRAEHRRSA